MAVVVYRLGELDKRIDKLGDRIDSGFAGLHFVAADVYAAEQRALRARIDQLEDKARWTARMIGTTLAGVAGSVILMLVRGG